MNIFEKFSMSREVTIKEGEITLDKQRMMILPVNFVAKYSLKQRSNAKTNAAFYNAIKKGMIEFSKPLGVEYSLSYKDFLDRWVKYTAFAGWGNVEYKVIDPNAMRGLLNIRNFPLHLHLKEMGVKESSDPLMEAMIAGSLSGTFRTDIDVVETKCICSGNDACVYYWGPREALEKEFPDIVSKHIGNKK